MSMRLFALVRRPSEGPPEVRGVFTTPGKAEAHDEALKGMWVKGEQGIGRREVNRGSLLNFHEVVPFFANEELDLR